MSSAPQSGRDDYDQLVKFRQPRPGEPYFLLWGHDRMGGDLLRVYAAMIHAAGADPAMAESALRLADAFDAFPEKRLCDADHLSEADRKQLAYALTQRAMRAGGDQVDAKILLAEERAMAAAFGRVRPMLLALLEGLTIQDEGRWVYDPASRDRGQGAALTPCPIEQIKRFVAVMGRPQLVTEEPCP